MPFSYTWLGTLSLNLSFYLYLCGYLPQVLHNYRHKHLRALSLGLHFSLYLAYSLDLLYGFLQHLPWQYKTVSFVGYTLLTAQHVQLMSVFWQDRRFYPWCGLFCFLIITLGTLVIYCVHFPTYTSSSIARIGYISRGLFFVYLIPQLLKHKTHLQAISLTYLRLSLVLAILDGLSAWCLDWGWANRLAPPVTISLLCCMIRRSKIIINANRQSMTDPRHF